MRSIQQGWRRFRRRIRTWYLVERALWQTPRWLTLAPIKELSLRIRTWYRVERDLWYTPRWLTSAPLKDSYLRLRTWYRAERDLWHTPRWLSPALVRDLYLRVRTWYLVERALWPPPRWVRTMLLAMVPLGLLAWVVAGAGGRVDPRLRAADSPVQPAPENLPGAVGPTGHPRVGEPDPALDPASAHARLAGEYLKRNRLAEAAGEFQKALQVDERDAGALLGLSQVAVRTRDRANALELARSAARLKPQDPDTLNALAVAQALSGQLNEASKTFERAVVLRPDSSVILLNAASCAAQARRWGQAEAYCRRALAAAPGEAAARMVLAAIYLQQGRLDEGAAELEAVLAARPDTPVAQELLGRARLAQGRLSEARKAFEQAQRLRPTWPIPYLDAGIACLRQKDAESAGRCFEEALRLAPDSVMGQLGMADVCERRGQRDQAIEHYEKALAAQPDLPITLNNLAYALAQQGRDLDRALAMARRAVDRDPRSVSALDTLGWVCYRAGQPAESISHLRSAAQLAPNHGLARYHLGKALLAVGKAEEAIAFFQSAIAMGLPLEELRDAQVSATTAAAR
jgi:tetratricopeptide (TPR) repeat protein